MSALLRALSRRIRLALHRHDPPWQWPRPTHDGGKGGFNCPHCWTPPGEQHELSCPEVTAEQFRTFLDGRR